MTIREGEVIGPDRLEQLAEDGWSIASGWHLKSGGYYYTLRRIGWHQLKLSGKIESETLAQLAAEGWTLISDAGGMHVFERPAERA